MNKYESVIIIKPNLTDDEIEKIIEKVKETIISFTEENANELEIENLGMKKLAYSIKGNSEGIYVIFTFDAEATDITELERLFRIKDEIIKFIVIRKDD